jgi:hypothetical protein
MAILNDLVLQATPYWTLKVTVPSNTALLTDAFHFALRAARGAAKRAR